MSARNSIARTSAPYAGCVTIVSSRPGGADVLLLANDVRAEARFADLVRFTPGDTGVPYDWEYGDRAGKS